MLRLFLFFPALTLAVQFINEFNSDVCIQEGQTLSLLCTVEDETGNGATMWDGSNSVFNCPNFNTLLDRQIVLLHALNNQAESYVSCTNNLQARIISQNGSLYTSVLMITTKYAMNGGEVACQSYYEDQTRISTVLRIGAIPSSPSLAVTFPFSGTEAGPSFRIDWAADHDTPGGISRYDITLQGECGEICITDTENSVQSALQCFDWHPGENNVCNVSIAAITADCNFYSSLSYLQIFLQKPTPPAILEVIPTYSTDGSSLLQIEATLEITELYDKNGLMISFSVEIAITYFAPTQDISHICQKDICANINQNECHVVIELQEDCPEINRAIKSADNTELTLSSIASTSIGQSTRKYKKKIRAKSAFLRSTDIEAAIHHNLVIIKYMKAHALISSNIRYGRSWESLGSEQQINRTNNSVLSMVLYDTPYKDGEYCMTITLMAYPEDNNTKFMVQPIKVRLTFKGFGAENPCTEEIIRSIFLTIAMCMAVFFCCILIPVLVLVVKGKKVRLTATITSGAAETMAPEAGPPPPSFELRTLGEPFYDEIIAEPKTTANISYETPPQIRPTVE